MLESTMRQLWIGLAAALLVGCGYPIVERTGATCEAGEVTRELTINEVAVEIGLSTTRTWVLIRDAYRHIRSRLQGL